MTRRASRRTSKPNPSAVLALEVLVEEESASAALRPLLSKLVGGSNVRVGIRHFRGKPDLLKKLPERLRGYAAARARGEDIRVVVLVDKDADDCVELKKRLDDCARQAGLVPRSDGCGGAYQVLNRIAVRELEAWYFGDWEAVRAGFPKVGKRRVPSAYWGNPDIVTAKASEAFERMLRSCGARIGSKPEWAKRVGRHLSADGSNRSPSFQAFVAGVREILANARAT